MTTEFPSAVSTIARGDCLRVRERARGSRGCATSQGVCGSCSAQHQPGHALRVDRERCAPVGAAPWMPQNPARRRHGGRGTSRLRGTMSFPPAAQSNVVLHGVQERLDAPIAEAAERRMVSDQAIGLWKADLRFCQVTDLPERTRAALAGHDPRRWPGQGPWPRPARASASEVTLKRGFGASGVGTPQVLGDGPPRGSTLLTVFPGGQ